MHPQAHVAPIDFTGIVGWFHEHDSLKHAVRRGRLRAPTKEAAVPRQNPILARLAIAARDLAWEGALLIKFVRTGERKAPRTEQINPSLAQVLAGQVAAGLAQGDADPTMCLVAIGLMLRNATDDDVTHRVLDIAGATTASRHPDGSVVVSLPLR